MVAGIDGVLRSFKETRKKRQNALDQSQASAWLGGAGGVTWTQECTQKATERWAPGMPSVSGDIAASPCARTGKPSHHLCPVLYHLHRCRRLQHPQSCWLSRRWRHTPPDAGACSTTGPGHILLTTVFPSQQCCRTCVCVAAAPHRELQRVAGRKVDEQQPSAGVQRQVALQQTGCTVTVAAGGCHVMAAGGDISLMLAC